MPFPNTVSSDFIRLFRKYFYIWFFVFFRLIRIELNQTHCSYYTEIDSILLIGCIKVPIGHKKALIAANQDLLEGGHDSTLEEDVGKYCGECGGVPDKKK